MRKSVLLPAAAVAGGVVGLVVRRVYLANGFEAGTGLPIAGAPSLWAMAIVTIVVLGLLVALSCGKHKNYTQCYTGASPGCWPGPFCWAWVVSSPWLTGSAAPLWV